MKVLKIKDEVNLKDLELFGFSKFADDCMSLISDDMKWEIDVDGIIRYKNLIYSTHPDKSLLSTTGEIGVSCMLEMPAFIYYLVKCDFVEVVEVE